MSIIGDYSENEYSLPRSKTQIKAVPKKPNKLIVKFSLYSAQIS